jgi:hypothetical protein
MERGEPHRRGAAAVDNADAISSTAARAMRAIASPPTGRRSDGQAAVPVPVVGNGDLLFRTSAQARAIRRRGVMSARGVLIKPWLFREVGEGCDLAPTAAHDHRHVTLARNTGGRRPSSSGAGSCAGTSTSGTVTCRHADGTFPNIEVRERELTTRRRSTRCWRGPTPPRMSILPTA